MNGKNGGEISQLAPIMSTKSRELLLRAIGMLEGAAWMADKAQMAEMLDSVADMIREAIGKGRKDEDDA